MNQRSPKSGLYLYRNRIKISTTRKVHITSISYRYWKYKSRITNILSHATLFSTSSTVQPMSPSVFGCGTGGCSPMQSFNCSRRRLKWSWGSMWSWSRELLSPEEHDLRTRLKKIVVALEHSRKMQCARMKVLKEGDANARFFHIRVNAKRWKIFIHRLEHKNRSTPLQKWSQNQYYSHGIYSKYKSSIIAILSQSRKQEPLYVFEACNYI